MIQHNFFTHYYVNNHCRKALNIYIWSVTMRLSCFGYLLSCLNITIYIILAPDLLILPLKLIWHLISKEKKDDTDKYGWYVPATLLSIILVRETREICLLTWSTVLWRIWHLSGLPELMSVAEISSASSSIYKFSLIRRFFSLRHLLL